MMVENLFEHIYNSNLPKKLISVFASVFLKKKKTYILTFLSPLVNNKWNYKVMKEGNPPLQSLNLKNNKEHKSP